MDWGSALGNYSDPICTIEKEEQNIWKQVAQTEKIDDTLNPEFTTQPEIEFSDGSQMLKFVLFDYDKPIIGVRKEAWNLIGFAKISVDELLQAQDAGTPWMGKLEDPDHPEDDERGHVLVNATLI